MRQTLFSKQHLSQAANLPERPAGLEIYPVWSKEKLEEQPRQNPRNARFICSIEWSWGPRHVRIDNLYLGRRHRRWVLWNNWVEDVGCPSTSHWDYLSYTSPIKEVDPAIIAAHMLLNLWEEEKAAGWIDEPPHWIAHEGLLSISSINAISRAVWNE